MKKKLLLMILLIFLKNNIFASDGILKINKGQIAPFNGVLLSDKEAKRQAKKILEGKKYKLISQSLEEENNYLNKNIELQNKKINTLLDENAKLYVNIKESNSLTNIERIIWFGLGILATGAAFYGVQKITK